MMRRDRVPGMAAPVGPLPVSLLVPLLLVRPGRRDPHVVPLLVFFPVVAVRASL